MGLDAYRQVLKKAKLSTDPVAIEQVRRVGRRIAEATGRTDYQWEFNLIEDKQANAFCLPGGKVAVYTGILPITRDDSGLAAVLGHEVSHAIARHGGERVTQTLLVQMGLAATQVALARNDPAVVQQVTALLGAGATVGLLLPWSRAQESEADHLGLIFMAKAGYDPHAALDLWNRMAEAAKGRDRPPEYLSTHPSGRDSDQADRGLDPGGPAVLHPPLTPNKHHSVGWSGAGHTTGRPPVISPESYEKSYVFP